MCLNRGSPSLPSLKTPAPPPPAVDQSAADYQGSPGQKSTLRKLRGNKLRISLNKRPQF